MLDNLLQFYHSHFNRILRDHSTEKVVPIFWLHLHLCCLPLPSNPTPFCQFVHHFWFQGKFSPFSFGCYTVLVPLLGTVSFFFFSHAFSLLMLEVLSKWKWELIMIVAYLPCVNTKGGPLILSCEDRKEKKLLFTLPDERLWLRMKSLPYMETEDTSQDGV